MRSTVLTLAAIVLTTSPAFAQAPTARDVLKKAVQAHGGADVLNKYTAGTSKMKGKLLLGGFEFPFSGSLAFAVPGKVHLTIEAEAMGQKMTVQQIINGEKVVQLENGKQTRISDTMRQELQNSPAIQEMSLLTPLLDEKKYTLELGKDVEVDGKPAHVVIVKGKNRKEVTLSFDVKTGYLVKMSRKALNPMEMEVTEDSVFTDFRNTAGMIVPMKFTVDHDGRPFMAVEVTEYKPLEKLDDKAFTVSD